VRSRLVFILPIAGFAVLAFFLFKGLWGRPADQIPSVLINKPAPLDQVPALDAQTQGFGPKELKSGKVVVVNFFSSTCVPCRLEAPVLNRLAQTPGITLYGYVWKDKPENARAFLNELGNPFSRIGVDTDGRMGMNWGVRGWPETFVVDGKGIIRFKYDAGELTPEIVKDQLLPAIEAARRSS
jgi:cytochrome c biogenesis protein CcmG/thiol:disulfide interchange protein DsbE